MTKLGTPLAKADREARRSRSGCGRGRAVGLAQLRVISASFFWTSRGGSALGAWPRAFAFAFWLSPEVCLLLALLRRVRRGVVRVLLVGRLTALVGVATPGVVTATPGASAPGPERSGPRAVADLDLVQGRAGRDVDGDRGRRAVGELDGDGTKLRVGRRRGHAEPDSVAAARRRKQHKRSLLLIRGEVLLPSPRQE